MPLLVSASKKGIGLIEVVVALGISIIIVTSIVSLSIYSLRSSTQSKFMLEGAKMADQEIELLRASRDKNKWSTFMSQVRAANCGSRCYVNTTTLDFVSGQENLSGGIIRFVTVSDPVNNNEIDGTEEVLRFSVTVTWPSGGTSGISSTYTYTDLSSWVGD